MGRFYLTTPIYYVTDAPHVGTAYCTVNADAMARFHRLVGDEVLFLTGTDEHGQKVAEAAAAHGVTPLEWADRTSQRFFEAWELLNISYDDFIRTTEDRHTRSVQAFLTRIYENGHIYKDTYRGPYCVACEDYYTVETLENGTDCPVHHRPVIEMSEENWFFRLSAFQDQLLEYYESHPSLTTPETKKNEALGFIKGGLKDISITRASLNWGIPVPWDESQVFYVWYDALINYLTAVGYGVDPELMNTWWPQSHHLIGKEILRFHCVWWPAMCLAAGIEPPHHVQVHGWLLVGGEKLGKTMGAAGAVKLTGHPGGGVRRGRRAVPPAARHTPRQRRGVLPRTDDHPIQRGPRQQSGQSRGPRSHGRGLQVRRRRSRAHLGWTAPRGGGDGPP
jgi:methionyl-tRNA synthetase